MGAASAAGNHRGRVGDRFARRDSTAAISRIDWPRSIWGAKPANLAQVPLAIAVAWDDNPQSGRPHRSPDDQPLEELARKTRAFTGMKSPARSLQTESQQMREDSLPPLTNTDRTTQDHTEGRKSTHHAIHAHTCRRVGIRLGFRQRRSGAGSGPQHGPWRRPGRCDRWRSRWSSCWPNRTGRRSGCGSRCSGRRSGYGSRRAGDCSGCRPRCSGYRERRPRRWSDCCRGHSRSRPRRRSWRASFDAQFTAAGPCRRSVDCPAAESRRALALPAS